MRCGCSALVGGAETAAAEEEHEEPASDPDDEGPVEVVGDVPWHVRAPGCVHGSGADGVVLGEQERGAGGEDSKLEDAHEQGAVDGADSPVGSPGADEHKEGVEADETEEGAHESGEDGHLRALLLAVDVAVVDHVEEVFEVITVDVLVVVVDATDAKVDAQVCNIRSGESLTVLHCLVNILISGPVTSRIIFI